MKFFILGLSAVFLLTTLRSIVISGPFSNNSLFFAVISLCVFLYGWFFDKLKTKRPLTIAIVSMFASFIVFSVFLAVYGNRTTATYDEEVIIVLGAGTRQGVVLPPLRKRLEAAFRYHQRNPAAFIVVAGGLGYREPYSESVVMARFLIELGVPESRIILESYSTSTFENILFARDVLTEWGIFEYGMQAAIVTNDFHIFRGVSFANNLGFDARSYPAPTPLFSMFFMYPREVAATIKMWIIGS